MSVELNENGNSDKHGFATRAFELAEKYRDFRSLAALCNKDLVYPSDQNPHASKIAEYIERFRDEFTDELCQWYIEHGISDVLMTSHIDGSFNFQENYGRYLVKGRHTPITSTDFSSSIISHMSLGSMI